MFGPNEREHYKSEMKSEFYDLCIIGGGITGAGIARDAALRGMKVALVEADDFASGTSSRSSKLIHGGIRYLENLEFGLVHEALTERRRLFEMAPHLVHPLRFVLPLYKGGRVGMFKMGLGMWLYDLLALFEMPEIHERLSRPQTEKRVPFLKQKELLGSYVYSDAYMDDDRLVLETLRSANESGAHCVNFVKATGAEFENDKVAALKVEDQRTLERWTIKAHHFISCVGPWTDRVGQTLLNNWSPLMRPSKGIHLTLDQKRLPLKEAVVMATDGEKRIVFAIPRHEMVIIGTTDTDYAESPCDVHSDSQDVEYVLNVVNEYFPGAKITKDDILASYAGVRPLVNDGASTESKTSREHLILSDDQNVTFVTGGKYTTYRHMAEETMDRVLQALPIEKQVQFGQCLTSRPLNKYVTASNWEHRSEAVDKLKSFCHWSVEDCQKFVERHGGEAEHILKKYYRSDATLWQVESRHAIQETMCLNVVDFYLRRAPLFLARKDHGYNLLDEILSVFAEELSWDSAEQERQKQMLKAHEKKELSWKI